MLDILYALHNGGGRPIRFTQLLSQLKIPPKTLSQRLKALVEAGFVSRRAYNEIPPRVEYQPTSKIEELGDIFSALNHWAARNSLTSVSSVQTIGRVPN